VVYIVLALVVVFMNAGEVPGVLALIFESAFGLDSAFGAIIGSAVMWGVKRGIYSNEAGQGSGPHAAAAAEVSHPAKQGLVQAFAVYVDTLFICSATGFLILSTGAYRVFEGESATGAVIADGGILPADAEVGPTFAQTAFDTLWSGAGSSFIAISLAFFCFTTLVAYYYMAETNLRFILGKSAPIPVPYIRGSVGSNATMLLQALILVSVVLGAVSTATEAWTLGDIGVGLMAWLNIVGIIILQQPAYKALWDYERQKKAGLDPTFDPIALDIAGASFWETYDPLTGKDRETAKA
jgi:alanine or glycine:cation symporter, AGCS family